MTTPEQWVAKLGNRIERQRFASQPALLKELIEQVQRDAAAELEALAKEVERLKQLHTTDMRVTNESADFHMKRCDQLRTQNRELREAMLNVLGVTQHWAGCGAWTNGPCDCVRLVITKALAQTEVKHG